MCTYVYIYIYIYRERDRDAYMFIYIYIFRATEAMLAETMLADLCARVPRWRTRARVARARSQFHFMYGEDSLVFHFMCGEYSLYARVLRLLGSLSLFVG